MIEPLSGNDFEAIHGVINDAAQAYRGVIPADRWREPYMSRAALQDELDDGVVFHGARRDGRLTGVMGLQDVDDVTLIRHAYVRTASRRQGIGGELLRALHALTPRPVLVGTWADARWAVSFYERHGFALVSRLEKDRLLGRYWSIPARQVETSVVLGDARWFAQSSPRP